MAKYFNYFPKTFYSIDKKSALETVTNIISRFTFENSLKQNSLVYYTYLLQDGDTPEIIAHKFYGNSERHWIVLMFNDVMDPQFDWTLSTRNFNEYVNQKYADKIANTVFLSGFDWAASLSNVHSYYKVITRTSADGTFIEERIQITEEDYNNVATTSTVYTLENNSEITETITKDFKTYLQYESEINEEKRTIKLLKPEFIPAVEKEFKRVIK